MTTLSRVLKFSLLTACASVALSTAALSSAAWAQQEPPPPMHGPSPAERPIPEPKDIPYPGVIKLRVDATDLDRKIYTVKETIPVTASGPMTLLFPKWLPGHHSPTNPVDEMAGLVVHAGGQVVPWTRDPLDVYAFHIVVPQGAKAVDLDFQFLNATAGNQGRNNVTPEMLNLKWDNVTFYPAGYYARQIQVDAAAKLPEGWKFATALDRAGAFEVPAFKTVPLDVLIDSPMYAGLYMKRLDLDPGGVVPVHLNVFADDEDELDVKPEQLEAHKKLVQQAYKAFASHHYNHYDFLLSISDKMSGQGLEHHRSSENGTGLGYFKEWDKQPGGRDLLAHEYTHSWDGKFRRGADLWTPNYDVPMRDSLLWVYEGQTQYWGYVLAARAGLWTKQQALDSLAATAASYSLGTPGRDWRPMIDTTNDPIISSRRPLGWRNWQRSEDYYSEGQLIWLEADQLIRQKTGGQKSLDDFAGAFFGVYNGSYTEVTYTFEDVVRTLNSVYPYDWATFLKDRVNGVRPEAPLAWIGMGGYRLVYTDTPSDLAKKSAAQRHSTDLVYSLGVGLNRDGTIGTVLWNSPAFKQGLTIGQQVIAVNGVAFDGDKAAKAVTAAKGKGPAVEFLVKNGDRYKTYRFDYHEGLKYPHLEPLNKGATAGLDQLLAAR